MNQNHQWKVHLTMKSKFLSSTGINENRTMYFKSSIAMIGNDTKKSSKNFLIHS